MSTSLEVIIEGLGKYFSILGIDFFIVGAQARDIISNEVGLKLSPRKTADVDFGLFVDSWATLETMRDLFKSDKNIKLSGDDNKVRYYYNGTPFDLVPFGGVEKEGKVSWPPFYDSIMTVTGYKEALENAKTIKIRDVSVKVVTPEMLVALKVISWDDNPTRQKDAQDINFIFTNYEKIDADSYECLLDNHENILEKFDYDTALSSISLLGLRIKMFTSKGHTDLIKSILNDTEKKEKLTRNMCGAISINVEEDEAKHSLSLDALLYGINL